MPRLHDVVRGPWRTVADLGWSIAFAMSGLSIALATGGLAAPVVGRLIDRYGGAPVMTAGSLVGAAGLFSLAHTSHRAAYLGIWVVLGFALSASLYDAAFATLGRIFGPAARRP